MAALTTIALVGSAAVGAYGSIRSASAQRRASRLQELQQQVATRRSRRQAIRQAQLARSQAIAGAAALGALSSSGIQGGTASLGSQLGSELGFSSQMSGISAGINSANRQAASGNTMSQLGFGAFQSLGGLPQLGAQFGFNTGVQRRTGLFN